VIDGAGNIGRESLQEAQLHAQSDELLLGAVVEVALDLLSLRVLSSDQPPARRPELVDRVL
jgi:hypothetical protein